MWIMKQLLGYTTRFKKLNIELPYDPAIPLLDVYPRKTQNTISKIYIHPNIHSSTVYNSQDMEMT